MSAVRKARTGNDGGILKFASKDECPNAAGHTVMPRGYVQWYEAAEKMRETHTQHRCPTCGYWAIWRLSSEDATRPTPSTERPLMPSVPAGDGFFAAEGDERCGRVHVAARARCLMPKGHTGNHANTQGYWLDTEAADGWPEHVEDATRPTGDKG